MVKCHSNSLSLYTQKWSGAVTSESRPSIQASRDDGSPFSCNVMRDFDNCRSLRLVYQDVMMTRHALQEYALVKERSRVDVVLAITVRAI